MTCRKVINGKYETTIIKKGGNGKVTGAETFAKWKLL